jgi:hypothetical protein
LKEKKTIIAGVDADSTTFLSEENIKKINEYNK